MQRGPSVPDDEDVPRCGGGHQAPRGEGEGPRARRQNRPGAPREEQR